MTAKATLFAALGLVLLLVLLLGGPRAADAEPGDSIAWAKDLPAALRQAKEKQRIVLVCVNARFVEGRMDEEPAAKGLREVVYKDARVVKAARAFVCVLLTPDSGSADHGALRALGIDGKLTSPQHIFIRPDGQALLLRRELWPYGKGEGGVKAFLDLLHEAQAKQGGPKPTPQAAPAGIAKGRAVWIARRLADVVAKGGSERDAAIRVLLEHDKDGDCVDPLLALLVAQKKDILLVTALVRGLGRDGLERAALPLAALLRHKNADVRGNAAVSLEYIGSSDKKVIAELKRLADKEKDEAIANHAYRALGRCGRKDAKVRALLLKKAASGRSEFASYGPSIGLAYFERDTKAARGVEQILKRIGVPGSKRGGGTNAVKRTVVSWTLASIGNAKSGTFVREELMSGLEHVKAFWVQGLLTFWDVVARVCEGEPELLGGVEEGVRGAVTFVKGLNLERCGAETRNLMDAYRKGRAASGARFRPKGDNLLNVDQGK